MQEDREIFGAVALCRPWSWRRRRAARGGPGRSLATCRQPLYFLLELASRPLIMQLKASWLQAAFAALGSEAKSKDARIARLEGRLGVGRRTTRASRPCLLLKISRCKSLFQFDGANMAWIPSF